MARRMTTEEFKNKLFSKVKDEYNLLSEYTNNHTKVLIQHNSENCNHHKYWVRPKSVLEGTRCPECNNKTKGKKTKTTEQFKKELYNIVGEEYILVGEYNGVYNKVTLRHTECNKEWEVTPNAFISSHSRCWYCRIKSHNLSQRKPHEVFVKEVKDRYGSDYKVLGTYINSKNKILVRHKCGTEWEIKPNHLLTRDMCPTCKMSIGEKHVEKYLNSRDIKFETQKKFSDLVYKRNLSYDFYLPELNILIEYNGAQHYMPIDSFGGKEAYEQQVIKDNIKRKYANEKGYKLIEIKYTEKYYNTIARYLDKKLLV
ncbi:homing endonuclease [Staphylococcus phage pSco-10]|nr:homing endonuclease [Staphylococcus phage pSco-10]